MNYLDIGPYTEGTLRPEHLLDAVLCALDTVKLTKSERNTTRKAWAELRYLIDKGEDKFYQKYNYYAGDLYDDLCNIADVYCPPFAYWGGSEGDGASIGVWVSIDAIEEARREEEIADYATLENDYTGLVVDVSDHGNVTLYDSRKGKLTEIYSLV